MTKTIKKRFPVLFIASYLIAAVAIIGLSVYPYLGAQAFVFADIGGPGAPAATVGPSYTNNLVMNITLPDAWNGGAFTADPVVKLGSSSSFWQGDALNAIPALGTTSGVGYKEDGTAGFQGTEPVVQDLDADSTYTSQADTDLAGVGPGAGTTLASAKDADWTSIYFYDAVSDGSAWNAAADLIFDDDGNIYYDNTLDTLEAGTATENAAGASTEPAGWNLSYYDAVNANPWDNTVDWIGRDNDLDGVYSNAADTVVDCDGADGNDPRTAGSCTGISAGTAFVQTAAGDNLCADSLATPTCVWTTAGVGGDTIACTADDTLGTIIIGNVGAPCGPAAHTAVGTNWAYYEDVAVNGVYDVGEDLYIENVAGELTYTGAADNTFTGVAPGLGTTITTTKDSDWTTIYFYDSVSDGGAWNNTVDMIFEDDGNVYYDVGIDTAEAGSAPAENMLGASGEPAGWNLYYYDAVDTNAWDNTADWIGTDDGGSGTYSTGPDTDVYTTGGLSNGDALTNFAADCDSGGIYTQACVYTGTAPIDSTEAIVIDEGNAAGAAPNGVLDRQDDQLDNITLQNSGTALDTADIINVQIWMDGGNGIWDAGITDDVIIAPPLTWDGVNSWDSAAIASAIPPGGQRFYVSVDITATPTHLRDVSMTIPVLSDAATLGAYDAGDEGVFMASNNDGPTDFGAINAPTTIDAQAPQLQSFTSTTVDGEYGPTSAINITANYDETVAGGGSLTVTLDNGVSVVLSNVVGSSVSGTYNVGATGSGEDSADLTVSAITVENVTDLYGNTQTGSSVPGSPNNIADSSDIVVDTTAPSIAVIGGLPASLADADVGAATFSVNIRFDDTMDSSGANDPVFSWTSPAPAGLSFNSASWSTTSVTDDTYTIYYDLADVPETNLNIDLSITLGQDSAGNTQNPGNFADVLSIDTQNPSVTTIDMQDVVGNDGIIDRLVISFDEALDGTPGAAAHNLDAWSAANHGSCTGETADPDGTSTLVLDFACSVVNTAVDDLTLDLTAPTAGLADAAGNQVAAFSVGSPTITDGASPVITFTSPISGSAGVSIAANISVYFSEAMNTGTVTYSSAPDPGAWAATWNGPNTQVSYSHNNYTYSTPVTWQVTAGQDAAGNGLGTGPVPNPWTFTTMGGGGGGGGAAYPENYSVLINNDNTQTDSQTVTLSLEATNAAWMLVSEDPNFGDASWEEYSSIKTWTLSEGYGTKTVYAKYKSEFQNQSARVEDDIDYVEVVTIPPEQPVPGEPVPGEEFPGVEFAGGLSVGDLIKSPDFSAVYVLGHDGKRHAFPNEDIYFSWYRDFSSVMVVSNETLAAISLGRNVTMRPGTWLIKIKSVPNVYAVEPGGVIRWIETEEVAEQLYPGIWNLIIKDVSDAFFPDYTPDGSISTADYPTGSLIQYSAEADIYYIDEGMKRYISASVYSSNMFRDEFVNRNVPTTMIYPDSTDLPAMNVSSMMFP